MKCQPSFPRIWAAAALGCVLTLSVFHADAKLIRLRNQVIPAKRAHGPANANAAPNGPAASGLYLLQVHDSLSPEMRSQLETAGVDILRYVPDDAFVVRCRNVRLESLRAMPFVEWVGEYRPEYKVHRGLQAKARTLVVGQTLEVSALLIPRASPNEIAQSRRHFNAIRQSYSLRSGAVLRGTISPAQLDALAKADFVLWIEPAPHPKLNDEVASKIVAGDGGPNTLLTQSLGYDGSGVKVAVADSGLNNGDAATMHPDLLGRTPAFFYYGALTDAADEHSHGTHVAGIIAGNGATGETDSNGALYGLGVAPGASIIAQRIFDAAGNFEAPANGFSQLTQDATQAGAVIGSNSWGDDVQGRYDISAMEYDELVRDASGSGTNNLPYILEFSAGNAGPGAQTMDSPAVAKNVIATGASENDREDLFIYADGPDAMADFSSRGPCEDGRIKPDVVAPGTWISSLQSASASDQFAWLPIDALYQYQGGTSQAGPHASGAAAVFVQYYRQRHAGATPSPALVKAALINSATDMDDSFGTGPVPNMDEGWGRVDLLPLFDPALTFDLIDQTTQLTNGQVFEHHILIAGTDYPLKITLAYTDVPGFPGAIPALVNDLDLEVTGPDGTLYRGNQFNSGESIPNPSGPDTINNVEAVHLQAPVPGEYVARVRARKVVEDILAAPGTPRQDFALVISGQLPVPGVGSIFLDHGSYTAPSQIKITLIDTDQTGHPSETVHVTSGNEPSGENTLLTAAGSSGSFTGAMATATGPPIADGRLQLTNNDLISITYFDVSAGVNRIVTARGDLVPPVLSSPSITNLFGQEIISWTTSEPANAVVRYGTNGAQANLTLAVTNSELTTSQSVSLIDLVPGRTYYYYFVSTDEAGNAGTNNAGGALFSFVAPSPAPLLLVDEYGVDPLSGSAPPLSGYTAPLDAIGLNYDVWDVSTLGNISANTLRPYRALLWRVPDFGDPGTVAERAAVSNYVFSGGSLFIASMEVLSRLEEANATNFTYNVLQVQSYIVDPDSTGAAQIIGTPNETVGNGINVTMDYAVYDDLWQGYVGPDISDTMTPRTNSTAVLRNDFGDIVGLRWPAIGQQAPGRVVFFTFPLDAVPMGTGVNDRIQLVRNIVAFLAPGAGGLSTVSLDSPAYRLPSLVTVEVGDSNRSGQGSLTVTASSTTQTNGLVVTLMETARPGIFSGSFSLLSATNPPVSGKLRAKNGDTLRVDYFNAASNVLVSATAAIDTIPPVIANVAATPDYQDAEVSWGTSETADALVQFGESPLLGRTAYDANLTTSHAVTLSGLVSDRTYYYQVVSRDLAGNVAIDDNNGNLYTFLTLLPLSAPWADSMDTGGTNWSVYTDPNSQCEWTLGVPQNGQESSAHSPPDAWGSNLGGGAIDSASTFLISPAIELPSGKGAMLSFWHSYDFVSSSDVDIYEYGQVLLITNGNSTAPVTLIEYSDDLTPGWEPASFDLTPYAGQLIYLVWDYELFSFDTRARPGWLVDDVALTVNTLPFGTIVITNNLWQAVTTLTGPVNRTNNGLYTVISNAPLGAYTATFSTVPSYNPVAQQTNILTAGNKLVFQGIYTFPDVNHNGISDLWEQQFFGAVSPGRTQTTDTDGDGMSDYAEFIAGTDPNNSNPSLPSALRLSAQRLPDGSVRLQWPSSTGRGYCVLGSTNGVAWTPVSGWMQAASTNTTWALPTPGGASPYLFRVQVSP